MHRTLSPDSIQTVSASCPWVSHISVSLFLRQRWQFSDFQLSKGWQPLTLALFKGQLYAQTELDVPSQTDPLFFFSLTQNTFQLLIINSSLLPCFRASPAGQRSHRAGTTCLQPPTPGLPREDAGTQDLGLVGTGLRAKSRPVSLIRRVDALLHWSLPRGSVCPGLHACLRLPGAGWPKPQACPGLLCTPDKKRHCHKGGSGATPHRPHPHRRPVVRAPARSKPGRHTGGARHTDRTWPLPTSPVGPRGSGAGQLLPSKERPSPGCGREGKGPGASPLSAGLPRGRCPALPAPCLLALPGQPAHGGPPPRLPLFLAVGGPARCLAHLSPLN